MPNRIHEIERHMLMLGVDAKVSAALLDIIRAHASADSPYELDGPSALAKIEVGEIARMFHRSSLRRGDVLGQPVADPGWNMLLALVADTSDQRPSCVTSLCYASGAPMTTALRHLARLEKAGLVLRREHKYDARRSIIEPTRTTMSTMTELIMSFCIQSPTQ